MGRDTVEQLRVTIKHFSVGVAFSLLMQTFAAIWWASRVTVSVSTNQATIAEIKAQLAECRLRSATYDELNRIIATVNEKLADNRKRIEKLEDRR